MAAKFLRAVLAQPKVKRLVQQILEQSPHCGALFALRGQTRDMSAPGSSGGPPD